MLAVEVTSLSLTAVGLAFVAGLVTFISPCVLPLLPVYLSFIGGVGVEQLGAQRRRLLAPLLFVAGFTVVFMLWVGAGGIGRLLIDYRHELTIAAGVFIAFSGWSWPAWCACPSPRSGLIPGAPAPAARSSSAPRLAIGWTPCVGYVLGGILVLAGSSQSAAGGLLLLVYSAGLGLPFVVAALAFDWSAPALAGSSGTTAACRSPPASCSSSSACC